MDINEIKEILPHRYPFLLIDKVISMEGNKIVAIKNVTVNENYFQGHFPAEAVMPGVLIIEALAQTGAVAIYGMELSLTQDNIKIYGHSIECRINAENPKLGFAPSPGKIKFLNLPGGNGVRVDTAVYNGYTIPPNYDSMIAKLIVHGKSRDEAIKKMLRALDEFVIEGINTNIEFQISILKNQAFRLGTYDTSFISKEFKL